MGGVEHIGQRLRIARERLGMRQEDVAKVLRKTVQAVSSFESGRTRVDINTLLILCGLYKVDLYEILDMPWNNAPNARECQLLKQFRSASPELQSAAFAVLGSVAEPEEQAGRGKAPVEFPGRYANEEMAGYGVAARGGGILELGPEKEEELMRLAHYLDQLEQRRKAAKK